MARFGILRGTRGVTTSVVFMLDRSDRVSGRDRRDARLRDGILIAMPTSDTMARRSIAPCCSSLRLSVAALLCLAIACVGGGADAESPVHDDESSVEDARDDGPSGPGADVLGLPARDLLPARWVGEAPNLNDARAVLVRFWTDTCPYCRASLPAVEQLRVEHGPRGLVTVGVYHPKPPREVNETIVEIAARRLGYYGPVAIDQGWESLRAIWLESGPSRRATSASFLLDRDGRVRFVHPGPEFHPGDDPSHARCAADFTALEAEIESLLAE